MDQWGGVGGHRHHQRNVKRNIDGRRTHHRGRGRSRVIGIRGGVEGRNSIFTGDQVELGLGDEGGGRPLHSMNGWVNYLKVNIS